MKIPEPSILDILNDQLIPWVSQQGLQQLIVAKGKFKEMKRNRNFRMTPQTLVGPRLGMRSFAFNMTTAKWPEDHLVESSLPMLLFVTRGNADLRFGDYWLHAKEGQGVLVLPDVPRQDGSQPYLCPHNQKTGFCSVINFMEIRGRVRIWCCHSYGEIHESTKFNQTIFTQDDHAVQLMNQLSYHLPGNKDKELSQHLLMAFLLTIKSNLQTGRFIKPGFMKNQLVLSQQDYNPAVEAQQYVRTHLHEKLTLQEMARRVHMGRTQFATRFKEETHQTFNQFVTQCRIEQAKVLLEETDYTLTFVSLSVGYQSLNYFLQNFRKQVGMSAREYRESRNPQK